MSTREYRAAQLKAVREKIGDTQEVFAAKLSLPLSTYRRYEQAVSEIPLDLYMALIGRFGLDFNMLTTGKPTTRGGELFIADEDLIPIADKGLLRAIHEGAQLGDADNMEKIRLGVITAIRYALDRDRRGLPL